MPLFSFEGRSPRIDPTAFVAPTATLIGDVTVEAGASVWFNAVLRGDYGPIVVREGANVQDGSVLHAPPGIPVDIGPGATVAHMCVIHGVHVGSEALIANHATVLETAFADCEPHDPGSACRVGSFTVGEPIYTFCADAAAWSISQYARRATSWPSSLAL
jgi:hypothetical protein